jgi:glycerophosphoryl diester phosphodiesterase
LFDRETFPENSRSAFREAVRKGYAVELDVRLTKDEIPVVFHDATLLRMCGVEKKVSDCTYEELRRYPLVNTQKHILTLESVLEDIGGCVPVLVEMKAERAYKRTAEKTAEVLDSYTGVYAI